MTDSTLQITPGAGGIYARVSGRTLHKILFYDVGGQVSGEGPCGIYSNIIPYEAE